MREKIRETMEDMLMKNCKCDYTFVQDEKKYHQKDMKALDAYELAYKLSKIGNVECYIAPNGTMATRPVFTIKDGIILLSGQVVDVDESKPTPKEIYCALVAESLNFLQNRKLTTTYERVSRYWDENPTKYLTYLKENNLI